MSRRAQISLLAIVAAACALVPPLTLIGVGGPVRVAASLAVLALAPGTAIVVARRPAALELGLVLATSLACSTVAAESMLTLGVWAPRVAICALALLSLPPVATRLYSAVRIETVGLSGKEQ